MSKDRAQFFPQESNHHHDHLPKELLIALFFMFLIAALLLVIHEQSLQHHQQALAEPCTLHITFKPDTFLKTNDTRFSYDNHRVCLYGATIYNSNGPNVPIGSWTRASFTERLDWDIAMAKIAQLNIIRVTDFADNANSDMYSETIWSNMDYLIAQAQANGMFVLLDLSSYAKHLEKRGLNPYQPDQDEGWQQFIQFVANRTNTYTQLTYANTPNIAMYSIRGEVNQANGPFPSTSSDGYIDFFRHTTDEVFAADQGHHLIEAGGLSHLNQSTSGIPWQDIFSLPHVDVASIHVYSANRQSPVNGNKDLEVTLPMVADWAQAHHKPADLQEYGVINQIGDKQRAEAMKAIQQAAIDNHYQSIIYWNLGPELIAGFHYDVNPHYPLAWQQLLAGALIFYASE